MPEYTNRVYFFALIFNSLIIFGADCLEKAVPGVWGQAYFERLGAVLECMLQPGPCLDHNSRRQGRGFWCIFVDRFEVSRSKHGLHVGAQWRQSIVLVQL